jgi:hypothetical protein
MSCTLNNCFVRHRFNQTFIEFTKQRFPLSGKICLIPTRRESYFSVGNLCCIEKSTPSYKQLFIRRGGLFLAPARIHFGLLFFRKEKLAISFL